MARLLPLLLGTSLLGPSQAYYDKVVCGDTEGDFYQFSAKPLDGTTFSPKIHFSDYEGKVVLVTNVATYWGLTIPAYTALNALAEFYEENDDFVILGFPCNQFGLQEPGSDVGSDNEIMHGIRNVRPGGGFEPKMTLFKKTKVNGANEDGLFTFLKGACSYTDELFEAGLEYTPLRVGDIHWNFEKFLIGKDGKPVFRYHPTMNDVDTWKADINALLNA